MSKLLLLCAAAVVALDAQTAPLGGPSLGFIFDARQQALRPVLGIPGAAVFGDPLSAPSPVVSATVSLRQNAAVVNDGAWKAITLSPSGVGNTVVLPDGLPASARVAVSETGTSAAFYDSANSALTVVTGITASSMAANPVSIASLPGAITRFAVGDDGSLLLSSTLSSGGEALFWIGPDGSTLQLAAIQKTASILLWNSSASALVADRAGNQIWGIQNPGANAALTLLASDTDGVSGPSGAALSRDGKQLWIANAGNQNVLGIDLGTRASLSLACGFELTTLLPMADGLSFRLNHPGKGPVWILDTAPGSGPRVVFIPAFDPAPQASSTSAEVAQ
jgi:hypothetical protein